MTHPYDLLTSGTASCKKMFPVWRKLDIEEQLNEDQKHMVDLTWGVMFGFEECGRNTFNVNHNLAKMLERTDCGAIRVEDLKFPFEAFFIKLDDVYVAFAGLETRVLAIFKGEAWVSATCVIPKSGNFSDIMDESYKHATDAIHFEHLRIFTLAIQFIAFLSQCPESAVLDKDHEKRRRLRKSLKRLKGKKEARAMESLVKIGSSTVYNVGDEFKDADTDVRLHWVRGHWRRQPFGPRDNPEYRLTWIKPFQRGSEETGQIQARKYDV